LESTSSDEIPLRRHKSTRELNTNKVPEEHTKHSTPSLPRSESTRRIDDSNTKKPLGRSGTTRGLQRHPTTTNPPTTLITIDNPPTDTTVPVENTEGPTFSKGSLLAKEEQIEQILYRQQQYEESQQNTLIHIDDRIKFAKGSLLDQSNNSSAPQTNTTKMTRSKSVREVSNRENSNSEEASTSRRHVSLRRRPTAGKKHHDVPLPNTTPITSNNNLQSPPPPYSQAPPVPSSNNYTLLQLDDAPERFHSRELHGRHVKPLLNFDSNERPTTTRK
jgi:hypothetical protein